MAATEADLVDDSLVYRYRSEDAASDGLAGTEGTSCMCSYWFVECLARAGQLDKARLVFEKMHGYSYHLGLYAEEMDPTGSYLGNFPQAFTHLGLVSCGCLDPVGHTSAERARRLSRRSSCGPCVARALRKRDVALI